MCFAKNTAVEAGEWVANQAVQLFGGMGYMMESEVERQYRDMRILGIGGGTTEILTSLAGGKPLGSDHDRDRECETPAKNRRGFRSSFTLGG